MSPEEYLNEPVSKSYKYIAIECNSTYEAAAAIYTLLANGHEAQWRISVQERMRTPLEYIDEDDDRTVEELAEEFSPDMDEVERKSMVVLERSTGHIFVRRNAADLPNSTRIISMEEYYDERFLLRSPATRWWNATNEMVQFYLANKYYKKNPTDLSNEQINNIYKKEAQ